MPEEKTYAPHQQKVIAEYEELNKKIDSLTTFNQSELYKTLPAKEQILLAHQRAAMVYYSKLLKERIDLF